MMYFSNFKDVPDLEADPSNVTRPEDPGSESLPFEYLGDRRFEVLAYRLKCVEHGESARVRLMQGVGERGRDVVVFDPDGKVIEIVQCKNLRKRLAGPQLRHELLKLAFHAFIDRTVLGSGPVRYEIWAPYGLAEPAAKLVDGWPGSWKPEGWDDDVQKVLKKYSAFKGISWDKALPFVRDAFGPSLELRGNDGTDLTPRIRGELAIFEQFFQGRIVMDRDTTKEALRSVLHEEGVGSKRKGHSSDNRHRTLRAKVQDALEAAKANGGSEFIVELQIADDEMDAAEKLEAQGRGELRRRDEQWLFVCSTPDEAQGGSLVDRPFWSNSSAKVIGDGEDAEHCDSRQLHPSEDIALIAPIGKATPLVCIGPDVLAEGQRVAASGNRWTLHIDRFLVGDSSTLCRFSDDIEAMPEEQRFVLIADGDEADARSIVGLAWRKDSSGFEVDVRVAPPTAPRNVQGLKGTNLRRRPVEGVEYAAVLLQATLGTPWGHVLFSSGFGMLIGRWLQNPAVKVGLGQIMRLDLIRLARIPMLENGEQTYPPLDFIKRVVSIRPKQDEATNETLPVELDLEFAGGGPWSGTILVATRPFDPDQHQKVLDELLAEAGRP